MTYLDCALNNLNIGGKTNVEDEYDFQKSIQKSYENPLIKHEWNTMYIMADFGEYFEDTWLKNEKVLCSLKFNEESKVLKVYPDFSNTRPYVLKIQSMEGKVFRYFIEHCSNLMPESIDSNQQTLIKKIREHSRNCVMNSLITETFRLPPKNKLFVFVFLEISAAKLFDYPDLFVEYSIHLPEGWSNCGEEALSGRTQLCRSSNNGGLVHFGHCVECFFEYNFINLENTEYSNKPYIYFEVLSKDSWDRYRTEGLCYTSLPISHSGMFHYNLKCFRFTTENPISEMRRFFIGDCHNYLDVSWVGVPDNLKENFLNKHDLSTTSTGELNVKMNIVHQSQEFLDENRLTGRKTKKIIFEQLSSSPLIKSVEQVIQEFKRARRELLEARKNV
ncbi:hypothetical protein ABEB36_007658 [Hypothenemus hampei]|uniref:Meckel syndrome type 1 protein n=1 Tax=Hypothenemus hampei TaxID=57062 RepID=A0ABD1EVQ9_HYPHA